VTEPCIQSPDHSRVRRWLRPVTLAAALALAAITAGIPAPRASEERSDSPKLQIIRDVVYGHKDGMALIYDVIKPPDPNGAAIVYVVSGGWVSRWAPPEERASGFKPLLDRGFTMLLVHHGSSPRYTVPEALEDVRRAVRHIRLAASVYEIDRERIGVFGGSAGGQLALMLGLASDPGRASDADPVLRESNRVRAVVAYYPPVDLRGIVGPSRRFPALDFDAELAPTVSPILHVSDDDPPTLLVHGEADRLVPVDNSKRLGAALEAVGVTTETVLIPEADHGFRVAAHRNQASAAMVAWFERHLLSRGRSVEGEAR